ncbi:MAG: DEAD/DEAH box helicase family protein [Clostridia bacterium]|nr:DEAD/DEAH box helicase family protein [Clostridia bacterium]
MDHLYQVLASQAQQWREAGYPCEEFPAVGEILEWQTDAETGDLRYLRKPQLRALEVYWYLRAVKKTPHIFDLYKELYPKPADLLEVLGLAKDEICNYVLNEGLDGLWQRLKNDNDFVRDFHLEALRESLNLDYPSYIFALAMGAGKTVLIGAIIATEFAMAIEYQDSDFALNALVFAPGKTIIEALRELNRVPYNSILPPRLYKPFAASVKLTFTRDGETDIPVIQGSSFNIIVTNIEKIRITAETIRKGDLGPLFSGQDVTKAKREIANRRLQTIASLPRLVIFSDEAHHLYGQSLDRQLKRVRQTVNYLAEETEVVCVVNTTGTPYYRRQPLKDVVIWYGLSEGIKDGYLKELAGNIQAYDFEGNVEQYVAHVIRDFFAEYGNHSLPNGAPAKLAMYFPRTDDLKELRPVIDQALAELGESPAACLVNTSESTKEEIEEFNRLNDPASRRRVILLVNKGTEGWNCPSLFACALVRKLKTSNNFVLQAASRCLRQIPGNTKKAKVYLSQDNFGILDRQLQETYGETIADLNREVTETRRTRIVLRKTNIPPIVVTQMRRTVVPSEVGKEPLKLQRPRGSSRAKLIRRDYDLAVQQATGSIMQAAGDAVSIDTIPETLDHYSAALDLAAIYRLDFWEVYGEIRRLYGREEIPRSHLFELAKQIEEQRCNYEIREERVERALALVNPEGFEREEDAFGAEVYTAEIIYSKDREHLLLPYDTLQDNQGGYGFHYTPYNFDSKPEKSFFEQMLREINQNSEELEDIYYTGALTDPAKTDFYVEYKDEKGKWRRYTPDFVIRRKDGKILIVEIKRMRDREHPDDGKKGRKAMAIRKWEDLNPDSLIYEMIFIEGDTVPYDRMSNVRSFTRRG